MSTLALACLAMPACNDDDDHGDDGGDDGSDDGGSAEGGSADGGSADGGSADGGSADGGSADGGSADGGSADGGSADGGSADGGSADTGASCEGGWYLGSVPYVGDGILTECNGNPPDNCVDGYYIVFDTGECLCLPQCSAFVDIGLGDACTTDGAVVCQAIQNAEGTSSGNFCVPTQWNLCGP
ncbi:MAG: hypothetical protein K1X88_22735 [Nannocystaceae bacterium]|nr:hypothetical protein [Nannocystaceae bacterium]